ncbi:hypothetical protein [Ramlibacter albus]|uniref:Uncharacterized protein n=1 Tax=Ramlibacter albus TaxID=2079448 RepID=A0A923M999_9BURK|nr:hypothetical protein [Ramlibacter albus]MBC5765253.1 hypothetical protein [Ramlibacter albus]
MNAPKLMDPSTSVFIHIAAEVDARPAFLPSSTHKKHLARRCKLRCRELAELPGVLDTAVFDALFVAPSRSAFLEDSEGCVRVARYDLAILIECADDETAEQVMRDPAFAMLRHMLDANARFSHVVTATNARRIGPVDHTRPGFFLFSYLFADSVDSTVAAWKVAAGTLQAAAGLDNAVALRPRSRSQYTLISHSRWERLGDLLRWLLWPAGLRRRLLDTFAAHRVAAMPIVYRLA